MSRFARDHRVIFWEDPVPGDSDEATLDVRTCPESGVIVVTPLLPVPAFDAGGVGGDQDAVLRTLLEIYLAGQQGPFVRWYCTPTMLPFSRHLQTACTVHDRVDGHFMFSPPHWLDLERELLEVADLVFTDGDSLCEEGKDRGASTHTIPASLDWDAAHARMAELVREAIDAPRAEPRAVKAHSRKRYDYLIVGAGFAGSVLAERLASQHDAHVLIIDKSPHVGGNAYDRPDRAGLLIQPYGPHVFHTDSDEVVDYLSQFTEWRRYAHRELAHVGGQFVPIDRCFGDKHQIMPLHGYTAMFHRMLDHPNVDVLLSTGYRDVMGEVEAGHIIYTGRVDEYFGYRFGELPYLSLRFEHQVLEQESFQPVAVVNYPGPNVPYSRVTEFKHLTGQAHPWTSVTYEYPAAEGDPCYPIPRAENQALYRKYEALADANPNVTFVGRLATYRDHDMDEVVGQALETFCGIDQRRKLTVQSSAGPVWSVAAE